MSLGIGLSNLILSIFRYGFSNLTLGSSLFNPVFLEFRIPYIKTQQNF